MFVFNPSPGFNCIVTALKFRTLALKTRTKFLLKFVRDISTKMTLSFFRASVSVRDLSTSRSTNSGIYEPQNSPPEHIPGFKCRATTAWTEAEGHPWLRPPNNNRPQPTLRRHRRKANHRRTTKTPLLSATLLTESVHPSSLSTRANQRVNWRLIAHRYWIDAAGTLKSIPASRFTIVVGSGSSWLTGIEQRFPSRTYSLVDVSM